MYKSAIVIALLASLAGLAGCATRGETLGTLGGAAVGYGVSGGSPLGTAVGGVVGYEAGRNYSQHHR
jgi:hypothetical protein